MSRTRETAAQLDSAIDTLLRGPGGPVDTDESELVATARLLRDALPRLHPRFGFEEHLAARLSAARRLAAGAAELPKPTPLRPALVLVEPAAADVDEDVPEGFDSLDEVDEAEHRRLGLVAGGAIASGVSLAGAAIVVWRRSRSSGGLF